MLKFTLGVVLLAVLVGSGATVYHWRSQSAKAPELHLSSASPDQTYVVTLRGQAAPPDMRFVQLNMTGHEVKADARKHGTLIFEGLSMYSGDGYDEGFRALYPEHRWLSDSILEFGQKESIGQPQESELYVANKTQNNIAYMYIRAGKHYLFLLFDLQRNSTTKLLIHLESWERIVGAEGKFDNGTNLSYRDVSFSPSGPTTASARYCIAISDTDVTIGSREFEGKKLDGANVPKADCAF